ncbi:hypothetical protein BGZ65_000857 [Modicella reniformis]|uniref:Uncharacterized protein n=1 Tax=Modicella reniformis TaxID=1440133 RepID=A0A9P6J4F8_9FUNG|nr:hypothetical protein BGZ65_000857 [Modicella reniformis]
MAKQIFMERSETKTEESTSNGTVDHSMQELAQESAASRKAMVMDAVTNKGTIDTSRVASGESRVASGESSKPGKSKNTTKGHSTSTKPDDPVEPIKNRRQRANNSNDKGANKKHKNHNSGVAQSCL